jgi:hypothetical protein
MMVVLMTENECQRLKRIQRAIAEQQRKLAANTLEASKRFASVQKANGDLLIAVKKGIAERDSRQHPPLNEI